MSVRFIVAMLRETETEWRFHKCRGAAGEIEMCAARIRHVALRDCLRVVDPETERAHRAPWERS